MITEHIHTALRAAGYYARIVSVTHLDQLQQEIGALYAQGVIDVRLHDYYLAEDHDFALREHFPAVQSLIIMAGPRHHTQVLFMRDGQSFPVLLPSNLIYEGRLRQQAEQILTQSLVTAGYEVRPASVPEKLLAVHSGLGQYGRNNICYVPDMGSFNSLAVFCSDLPCAEDSWQALTMLPSCEKCTACLQQCPTGAIVADRFLIHAERCLAFFNENPGAFPEWLDPAWHHCVVGCMTCQLVCPHNRPYLHTIENSSEFDAEETDLLLRGRPPEQLSAALTDKLRQSGLLRYYPVLARNLRVVLPHEH